MKRTGFFLVFISLYALVFSQEDSLRIHITLAQKIVNGKPTAANSTVHCQQIFSSKGCLIRELYYDSTYQISKYIVFFTDGDRIISEEHFTGNDSLIFAVKYLYNISGLKTSSERYTMLNNQLVLSDKILYNYSGSLLMSSRELNNKNKVRSLAEYSYSNNKPSYTVTSYKKPYKNGVKKEEIVYSYKGNLLISKAIIKTNIDKSLDSSLISYVYDDSDQLIEEITTKNKFIVNKKTYKYFPSGKIKVFSETDKDGNLLKLYNYMYKIRYMTVGDNKSVFE